MGGWEGLGARTRTQLLRARNHGRYARRLPTRGLLLRLPLLLLAALRNGRIVSFYSKQHTSIGPGRRKHRAHVGRGGPRQIGKDACAEHATCRAGNDGRSLDRRSAHRAALVAAGPQAAGQAAAAAAEAADEDSPRVAITLWAAALGDDACLLLLLPRHC